MAYGRKRSDGISAADLIKMMEEARKTLDNKQSEEADWREMSDEEWDKLLDNIDKYIDEFVEQLRQKEEMQEEAAQKAALEADAGMEATAAASAALAVAGGSGGNASAVGIETIETDDSQDSIFQEKTHEALCE